MGMNKTGGFRFAAPTYKTDRGEEEKITSSYVISVKIFIPPDYLI
jgi:hypothetical protein